MNALKSSKSTTTRKPNKKALAVAKDILTNIDLVDVSRGCYFLLKSIVSNKAVNQDLQDSLPLVENNCKVCALGACLISKARVLDNVPGDKVFRNGACGAYSYIWGQKLVELLKDVFTRNQCVLIETAFEGQPIWRYTKVSEKAIQRARDFYLKYNTVTAKNRLIAIMKNVRKHKGWFTP